ncbi:MAG: shikimate dehydrogenase [Acidimicrobiales bacterium]
MPISGATRVAGVIGSPIRHSLSPAIYNAAFATTGLDWVLAAFEVAPGRAAAALDAVRVLGLAGLSVTMPHKSDVAAAVDALSGDAAVLGAVNSVVVETDGRLVGHNTDGPGFLDALRAEPGFDPAGRRCAVVGAGGAARAVIRALATAGADEVTVMNRTGERAEAAAALAGRVGRVAPLGAAEAIGAADLIVNATPLGMAHEAESPIDPDWLHPGQVVVDLVYEPTLTPLLAAARDRGVTAVNGLGMLVHQAGYQFQLWTGLEPPVPVLRAAAERALMNRQPPT